MTYPRWYRRSFAFLFFVGGSVFLLWAVASVVLGLSAFAWPSTPAAISENRIETSREPKGVTTFRYVVVYSYSVGSSTFTGSRVQFGRVDSNFQRPAQSLFEEVQQNSTPRIRYLPLYPSLSTIKPGFSLWALLPLFGGISFGALAFSINREINQIA